MHIGMKIAVLFVIAILALISPDCFGRIGESNKQLIARFGPRLSERSTISLSYALFKKDGLDILCVLKKNVCIYESYSKTRLVEADPHLESLGVELTARLLKTFSDGKPWKNLSAEQASKEEDSSEMGDNLFTFQSLKAHVDAGTLHVWSAEWETLKESDIKSLELPYLFHPYQPPHKVVTPPPAQKVPGF